LNQFSKAGRSVLQAGVHSVPRIGDIVDFIIDEPLDEREFREFYREVVSKYDYFPVQLKGEKPVIRLIPVKKPCFTKLVLKIVLFSITFITVYLTGYGLMQSYFEVFGGVSSFELNLWSLLFTALFISALAFHEYGHIRVSKKCNMFIDGPYFIPAPPIQLGFIGTFGAVINMKTLPPDRSSLSKLGLYGPLHGFIAGLIIALIGLYLSPVVEIDFANQLIESGRATSLDFMPLTLTLINYLKPVPEGYTMFLHPLLYISFIVFLVTFLNLIPIGQLDGGHVVKSMIYSDKYDKLGFFIPPLLFIVGLTLSFKGYVYISGLYMSLAVITMVFKLVLGGKPHPGCANQYSTSREYRVFTIYLILLVLTTPVPLI